MKNANQKVVSLSEFKKARDQFGVSDAEQFIKYQQIFLRDLDQEIAEFLLEKRSLKQTEKIRVVLAKINGNILEIADWVEDQLETASGTPSAAELEKLRKITSSLVSRSEVTRKTLVDDMAQSRYYEQRWLLDPARIISLLFVGPVGIDTFIEKFVHVPHPDKLGHQVGEAAAAVGLYLAFKKHADTLAGKAYKQVKRAPAHVRKLALASAFEVAVRFKPVNDIEPSHPNKLRGGNRVVMALKQ
jgi:hypothetical protein